MRIHHVALRVAELVGDLLTEPSVAHDDVVVAQLAHDPSPPPVLQLANEVTLDDIWELVDILQLRMPE